MCCVAWLQEMLKTLVDEPESTTLGSIWKERKPGDPGF